MIPVLDLAEIISSLSLIAFGGGNVIIPELHLDVVDLHHWMTSDQFLDYFSVSRAVPGPSMLMVLPIGYHIGGISGAVVAVLCMFLPSSLIMYGCSTVIDRYYKNPWIKSLLYALAPVSMGLILSSAFILGKTAATGWLPVLILLASTILILRTRVSVVVLIICSGILGFLFLQGP